MKRVRQHPKAKIPQRLVKEVMERDGGKCVWCGRTHVLNMDHIIPVSKGGLTRVDNLQVLCNVCDSLKGNSIILSKEEGLALRDKYKRHVDSMQRLTDIYGRYFYAEQRKIREFMQWYWTVERPALLSVFGFDD